MVITASSQEWLVESHESMGSRITSRWPTGARTLPRGNGMPSSGCNRNHR